MRIRDLTDRLAPAWRVDRPVRTERGGTCRVSARVAGREVWFESADAPLEPSVEGIAGSFIVPAIHARKKVKAAHPVDPLWARNIAELTETWLRWSGRRWSGRRGGPALDCRPGPSPGPLSGRAPRPGLALFFTAGLDSFYTLLRGPRVDALVHVQGFAASRDGRERLERFEPELRRIARDVGCRAVVVRTNLREHPGFRRAGWKFTHGGALACVAHLLKSSFGSAAISSSDTGIFDTPWGSHQDTDPLYSSEDLDIRHCDPDLHRFEKHRALAAEPLVERHLWVCWEGRGARPNCGRCEKCLRTMVCLLGLDALERSRVFECRPEDLAPLVDRLGPVTEPYVLVYWADALEEFALPEALRAAIRRLLSRSGWDPGRVNRSRPAAAS